MRSFCVVLSVVASLEDFLAYSAGSSATFFTPLSASAHATYTVGITWYDGADYVSASASGDATEALPNFVLTPGQAVMSAPDSAAMTVGLEVLKDQVQALREQLAIANGVEPGTYSQSTSGSFQVTFTASYFDGCSTATVAANVSYGGGGNGNGNT